MRFLLLSRSEPLAFIRVLNPSVTRTAGDIERQACVRAGPRLLKDREAKVKAPQEALIAGEPQPFDFEALKVRKRAEYEGR